MNIYKYPLEWTDVQTLTIPAIKILDIQIQHGQPVMWAITDLYRPEIDVNIVMQGTHTDVLVCVAELNYISSTQMDGYVWHWFTDFGIEGFYQEIEDEGNH